MKVSLNKFLVLSALSVGMVLLVATRFYETPKFSVHGVVKQDKNVESPVELILVSADKKDSTLISMEKSKFNMQLDFEAHYLLVVKEGNETRKKILVSTYRPISTLEYRLKMVLDLKNVEVSHEYGLMEYSGFEGKFVIRPLRDSELKRRRYEFEEFYAAMLSGKKTANRR